MSASGGSLAAEVMHVDRVAAERDRYRAALEEIAGGECWQTRCPDDDLCDVCTAREALGALG